jgi:zinc protease
MLWLDSDRLGFLLPEITPEKVDIQRGVVQNERRQSYENRPYGLAEENLLVRLFPEGHPYRWPVIGSMADLSAATLEDVRDFFRMYYVPNNATMVIAGDVDPARVRKQVEAWFGDIPAGPEFKRGSAPAFRLEADVHGTLEDRVQLPRVYHAWHSTPNFAPDDAALQVLGQLLAAGKSSRLYRRLVYELQIANQVTAYQDAGRMDGKFVVFATARPGHTLDEVQKVLDEELARLAASGPTPREMDRVRNAIEAEFIGAMEEVGGFGGKANQLNHYHFYLGEPDSFDKDLERYRAVTAADVQRVARTYLLEARRVVLSVVPQGKPELAVSAGGRP